MSKELEVLRDSFTLVERHNLTELDIEIDSKIARDLVLDECITTDHPLDSLIFYCMLLIFQFSEVRIYHIFRKQIHVRIF